MADFLGVLADFRVVHDDPGVADLFDVREPRHVLILDRHGGIRGAAQVGQVGPAVPLSLVHTGRPADPDAGADGGSGKQGRQRLYELHLFSTAGWSLATISKFAEKRREIKVLRMRSRPDGSARRASG